MEELATGSSLTPEEQYRFYTLLNGGNFDMDHLDGARGVLGLVAEGGAIVDGSLVVGDAHNPTHRGELRLARELTVEERKKLSELGISALEGTLGSAA